LQPYFRVPTARGENRSDLTMGATMKKKKKVTR